VNLAAIEHAPRRGPPFRIMLEAADLDTTALRDY
jgi:hypothetical protein